MELSQLYDYATIGLYGLCVVLQVLYLSFLGNPQLDFL
jgi:hypothetical protein